MTTSVTQRQSNRSFTFPATAPTHQDALAIYDAAVSSTAPRKGPGRRPDIVLLSLGLVGEAGEVASALRKLRAIEGRVNVSGGDKALRRAQLLGALADTLYFVTRIAQTVDASLGDVIDAGHRRMERSDTRDAEE